MSKYTQEVYEIINSLTYDKMNLSIYERIDIALPMIFNFDFPIWSEEYRTTLERKIILHYFKKEICAETFSLWQLFLYERLNLIMPYYNKMYLSTIQTYDITKDNENTSTDTETNTNTVETTDSITTHNSETTHSTNNTVGTGTQDNTGSTDNTTTNNLTNTNNITHTLDTTVASNGTNEDVDCDTPQARIGGGDYASFIKNSTTGGTDHTSGTNTDDSTEHNTGTVNNHNVLDTHIATGSTNDVTNDGTVDGNGTVDKTTNTTNTTTKTITHNSSGHNMPIADLLIKYRESLINIDALIIEELHDLFMMIY